MADAAVGFRSLSAERRDVDLPLEGELPPWLDGALIRNGPADFRPGGEPVAHWFDGLAMLHKFAFGDGGVCYTNRFLRSRAYERAQAGKPPAGFATSSGSLLARLKAFLLEPPYDNANVIAERLGDRYLALTETPRWIAFDPATLETEGPVQYDGPAPSGQLACAHLGHDPRTEGVVNFEIEFGRTNAYHVHELRGPDEREHVATVPVEEPAYMHSFALTEHYVVLTEAPFVANPLDFFRPSTGSFVDAFRWEPERGTRFVVIDREAGEVVAEPVGPAFFFFHHVNAFEREGELVLDVETVPDAGAIGALSLEALREGRLDAFAGALDRFRIGIDGTATVERERIYEGGTALPRVSPEVRAREHRYVYAQGTEQPVTEWPGALVKVDVAERTVEEKPVEGYVSEPVFVPRPGGDREDDGVVLAVCLDPAAEQSALLVLDGENLAERARATVPHAIPFDFHGRYFPEL